MGFYINVLSSDGIQGELTIPYTPQQNGVAKRKNCTMVEMARSMMARKGLEKRFWAVAVATAVYLPIFPLQELLCT